LTSSSEPNTHSKARAGRSMIEVFVSSMQEDHWAICCLSNVCWRGCSFSQRAHGFMLVGAVALHVRFHRPADVPVCGRGHARLSDDLHANTQSWHIDHCGVALRYNHTYGFVFKKAATWRSSLSPSLCCRVAQHVMVGTTCATVRQCCIHPECARYAYISYMMWQSAIFAQPFGDESSPRTNFLLIICSDPHL
jgi:hypothetical protein